MMHSRWINGNLAFWDTQQNRLLDAWGPTVNKWLLNLKHVDTDGTTTLGGYTVTLVAVGLGSALAVGDEVPGCLEITTGATENDGYSFQLLGEPFKLASKKPCYFGIKLKIGDATQTDFIAGLCITDTALLGGLTDGAYFRKVDGSTTVNFVLEKDSGETTGTAHTLGNDTFVTLEFYFDGTNVDFFVDGVLKTRVVQTNLPDDEELTPSLEFLTGEGNSNIMTVEWARVIQLN